MNDQIPLPPRKWLLRIGLPAAVLLAAATILLIASWSVLRPATSVQTMAVVIRQVETDEPIQIQDDLAENSVVQAPGWVEADPFSVYAGALTEGVVKNVLVLEGDQVKQGQPVATLVDDDAVIGLRKAEASVQHLIADLDLAKAKLAQLPARVKAARAKQQALQDEVRRKTSLVESGAVAAGPVERLRQKLEGATADLEHLELEEEVLQVEIKDRESLLLEGQASRDQAALRLERMTVLSPIDGVIIERLTAPGSVIQFGNGEHGTHIVHLYDPAKLQVRADIPLAQAARVDIGHPARIVVDILPGTTFIGEVTRFIHRADIQKNTVEAKVRIKDPSRLLKPDMLARVRIMQPEAQPSQDGLRLVSRIFVPREALRGDMVMVMKLQPDGLGIARSTTVQTGPNEIDGWIEIVSGLSSGDRVILDDVKNGESVRMENN